MTPRHDQLEERIRQRWLKKRGITVAEHVLAEIKRVAGQVRGLDRFDVNPAGEFAEHVDGPYVRLSDALALLKEAGR